MEFRDLTAEEIDVRVSHFTEKGAILLLYKDARVDMQILDETVGSMNWQRKHLRDNANCIIEIWDEKKEQWISKEDTGIESKKDADGNERKGLASDSFKRAGFNWGIGRELYTSPFVFVSIGNINTYKNNQGKTATYDKFSVSHIKIEDKKITELEITNETMKKVVFSTKGYIKATNEKISKEDVQEIINIAQENNLTDKEVASIGDDFNIKKISDLKESDKFMFIAKLKRLGEIK